MGGKGGPLAFLNKKGWHPGNQRNQERVWKREQEALAEKKQIEELKKQYEEARQKEEMEAIAVAAGVKQRPERLDWMYQGGMVAKQEAEKRKDAQMLGEQEIQLPAEEVVNKADEVASLPSFYTTDNAASANEMWSKLHGDPMFAIKQQELMARKKLVANPVKMDEIRKTVATKKAAKEARRAAKQEAKAAKKAAKKAKKDKKRKFEASSSDSESSDQERDTKRARRDEKDPQNGQHHRRTAEAHQNGNSLDQGNADDYQTRDSHRNGSHRNGSNHRDSDARHRDSERDRDRRGSPRGERERERSRHGDRNGVRESGYDRRRREDFREPNDRSDRHDEVRRESRREDRRGERGGDRESYRDVALHSRPADVNVHHDSASAQGRDLVYGLNRAQADDTEDREARRRETERLLEEAGQKREAEEKLKASQRYQRKEHKTGRLTEEEKQQRLAEMTGNAAAHEEARWARLQAAREKDEADEAVEAALKAKAAAAHVAPGTHHQDTAKFLSKATKDIYTAEDASAADRISRRKYYNDRDRDDTRGAFRR